MELPEEVMHDFARIYSDADDIFGQMVKAGADLVHLNIHGTVPASMQDSEIMKCLKVTKVYKTPSDGGINCQVGFYGYFNNKRGVKTPAPLVVNVFEYGRSTEDFPKQPFFRKAFKKKEIERVMYETQFGASGGILTSDD